MVGTGEFVVRNRHTIIDIGIGVAAVTGCATVVGCGVVLAGGAAAHWGSDQAVHDDNRLGLAEIGFHTVYSAAAGRLCGVMFEQGCVTAAGFESGIPQIIARKAAAQALPRWMPIMLKLATWNLKRAINNGVFDGC